MDYNKSEKINEIRSHADIVDVISHHINVVRKGKGYFALCPFHNDSNPSLSISPEKQIYKCFVCNEAGNVFTFVSKFKKIPYYQAVKEVADMVGIDYKYDSNKYEQVVNPKLKVLYEITSSAALFYKNNLLSNKQAMDYCSKRDINNDIIDEFSLGYSSDSDNLITYLQARGFSKEDIYRSGVAIEVDGVLKDRFTQRLIFPLTDTNGNFVGFSGRVIEKSDMAKYVNSPESEIFVKGNTLYHYYNALNDIKKNKRLYICEGFMDCIALCKVGLNNSIALMGTAFTSEHLRIFKYLGVEIILTLDGDDAGIKNANKLANMLVKEEVDVKIIPDYKDVKDLDEYLQKYGKDDLLNHLNSSYMSAFDFNFFVAKKTIDLTNNENKKKFLKSLCKEIAKMNEQDRDIYVSKIHDELGFSSSTINSLIKDELKKVKQVTVMESIKQYQKVSKYQDMQLRILTQMLDSPEAIDSFISNLVYIENDSYRKIAFIIGEYYKAHKDNLSMDSLVADLFTTVHTDFSDDEELNKTLVLIDNLKDNYPSYNKQSFDDLIYELNNIYPLENRLEKIQEDIKFANTITEKNNLISETIALKQEIMKKKKEKNGRN